MSLKNQEFEDKKYENEKKSKDDTLKFKVSHIFNGAEDSNSENEKNNEDFRSLEEED